MYKYENHRAATMTDDGQKALFTLRDQVINILKTSGVIMQAKIPSIPNIGDSWDNMAFTDRLVELNVIEEIDCGECAFQHRIFRKARN